MRRLLIILTLLSISAGAASAQAYLYTYSSLTADQGTGLITANAYSFCLVLLHRQLRGSGCLGISLRLRIRPQRVPSFRPGQLRHWLRMVRPLCAGPLPGLRSA